MTDNVSNASLSLTTLFITYSHYDMEKAQMKNISHRIINIIFLVNEPASYVYILEVNLFFIERLFTPSFKKKLYFMLEQSNC